jgi:site-specific DNA-methyltransferase (adenine-specific)
VDKLPLDEIILGDCLEVMRSLPDKSVDLIVTDPPYNIGKAKWDKWKKQSDYVAWLGSVLLELQRVLKDNGSLYLFHNDFLQMVEIQNWINQHTKFVFKQMIVWNKKFTGCSNEGYLQGYNELEGLRNYQKMAEYILYYTFQDETGLTTVMLDTNNFSTLRQYFKDYQEALGLSLKQINRMLGHRKAEHAFYWKTTQWDLPTKETYDELAALPLKHEFVRREYEDLRREYEDLRYTFNNQKSHHSVWNYEIAPRLDHITPKPVNLIENIIKHSSNEGDLILDCMCGSGTTCVAAKRLKRHYIGIELSEQYCEMARRRVAATQEPMF